MNWNFLKERFPSALGSRTAQFTLPPAILEIQPHFVAGVRLDGAGRRVRRIGVAALESQSFEPHPNRPNVANREELHQAIRAVAVDVGIGTGKVGLLVPDGAVRVGILTFETLPDDRREAEALVRWKMRENLPFATEEARLSHQVAWREAGRVEVLAVAVKSSVLAEYESELEERNGGSALILPSTLALLPLLPEEEGAGQLLIHICCGWVTTVLVAESRPRFWRTREVGRTVPEAQSKAVTSEAARVLACSRDQLKVEVPRVWLCERPPETPELGPQLARALSQKVEHILPSPALGAALSHTERTLFERFGATVAGLVINSGYEP